VTSNHVVAVEAVMPDGSLERFSIEDPGPDLVGLLVGSEGTLGVVTKAWVRLTPLPQAVATFLVAFASVEKAIACVSAIIAEGIVPRSLEAMDRLTLEAVEAYLRCGYPRGAEAVLLIELDGPEESVRPEAQRVEAICRESGAYEFRAAQDEAERERLWEGRRGAYAALARLAPNVLVEDGVVPRDHLPETLRQVREIAARHGIEVSLLFHAGDGNLHPNIIFDERDAEQTARVKQAGYEILKACVEREGSLSGEHGIGADKRRAMAWLFTPATLGLFRRVKRSLDPADLANPNKIIPLPAESLSERQFLRPQRALSPAARFLVEQVRERAARAEPFSVVGLGSRISAIGPRGPGGFVSTRALDQVLELDSGNYTVSVEAGIPVRSLLEAAGARGLGLALPPWPGSLGGLLATRPWTGLRDQVLGMRVLLPSGEVVEFGGKVMKNVAGYDLQRFFLGSWGGFGIILEATLKAYSTAPQVPASLPTPIPFEPTRRHLALKDAFDPQRLLNPWLFEKGLRT